MMEKNHFIVAVSKDLIKEVIEHLLNEHFSESKNFTHFDIGQMTMDLKSPGKYLARVECMASKGFIANDEFPLVSFESRGKIPNEEAFRRSRKMQVKIREVGVREMKLEPFDDVENDGKPKKKRPPKKRI